ncbi:S8 family serine peptidase [Levilactobacillus brevis]|uniref:S8 family serine peptidase n=1 Tax=Levilactobacillus brevis TaxID=1580 RepID=UPI00339BCC4D
MVQLKVLLGCVCLCASMLSVTGPVSARKASSPLKVAILDGAYVRAKDVRNHKNLTKPSHSATEHARSVESMVTHGFKGKPVVFKEIGIFDSELSVSTPNFQRAIRICMHEKYKVINFSGGFNFSDVGTELLINEFTHSGGVMIAAAGNTYGVGTDFPANQRNVVSVGGLLHGKVAYYSASKKVNRWRNGSCGKNFGTSFATPRYTNSLIKASIKAPKKPLVEVVKCTE